MALDYETEAAAGKRIAVCDCETDPFKIGRVDIKPFLWGWYDGETYLQFDRTEDFIAHIRDRDELLYAHNGGKFDWHFILPHFDAMQPLGVICGRIARAMVGKCELRDSYNILPVALRQWGKDEIDYAIMEAGERDKPENRREIEKYLRRDCTELHDMVTKFIDRFGLHLTVAGTAMATWQTLCDMEAPRSSEAFYHAYHPFYYGGRVECFRTGLVETPFQVADINSAYPRAMMEWHPLGTDATVLPNMTLANTLKWIASRGAGLVFVRVRAVSRGAWPWRSATDNALYFPNDDTPREYTVTGWEFLAGLETETVTLHKIEAVHVFGERVEFSRYITHFYEARQRAKKEGDKAGDIFSKLLMNSLYGKFAANPDEYENYMNVPPQFAAMLQGIPSRYRAMFGRGQSPESLKSWNFAGLLGPWALGSKPLDDGEKRFYNIATAASITGWVRAYLWRTLCKSEGAIYCDTDSIAAAGFGEGVPFGDALGEWKHEGNFRQFAVGGRKLYAFAYADGEVDSKGQSLAGKWKTASKGVRLSPEQVQAIARGEEVTFQTDKPTFSIHHEPRLTNRKIRAVRRQVPTT